MQADNANPIKKKAMRRPGSAVEFSGMDHLVVAIRDYAIY